MVYERVQEILSEAAQPAVSSADQFLQRQLAQAYQDLQNARARGDKQAEQDAIEGIQMWQNYRLQKTQPQQQQPQPQQQQYQQPEGPNYNQQYNQQVRGTLYNMLGNMQQAQQGIQNIGR